MRAMCCVAVLLLTIVQLAAEPPGWNQWRGPHRNGLSTNGSWGERLGEQLELVWSRPLSPSYSGPITHDGLVFTTETVDRESERVTAFDLVTGKSVWTAQWPGSMAVPFFAAANGDWIRSTPACVPGHLVVLGMRDHLVSLDPSTGREQWAVDFPESLNTRLQPFGAVSSPLIDGDALFVQAGGGLCKIRLAAGEVLWTALAGSTDMMSAGAFSSPIMAELGGVRQLVVQTRLELCGVAPDSGTVLWREPIEAFRGMNILTPLVDGSRVFTAAHSGKSQLFDIGQSSRSGDQQSKEWSVQEVWSQKTQGYMSSPVRIGGHLYLHLKNQRFACLSLDTGEVCWTSEPFGKYWSMVHAGDKILALDSDGTLRLILANPTALTVLAEANVAEDAWAHLAIDGDAIIVRDLNALKVYRWRDLGKETRQLGS